MGSFERDENNFEKEWGTDMGSKKRVHVTLFEYIKDLIEKYEEEFHIQSNDLRFHNFIDHEDYKESQKREYICKEVLSKLKCAINTSSPENCPDIPFFGSEEPDARCIKGYLWDLNTFGEGKTPQGGEIPCPFCNTDKFIEYDPFNIKEYFNKELLKSGKGNEQDVNSMTLEWYQDWISKMTDMFDVLVTNDLKPIHPMVRTIKELHPTAHRAIKCMYCGEYIYPTQRYKRTTCVYEGIYDWISHEECSKVAHLLDMFDDCDDEGLDGNTFIDNIMNYVNDNHYDKSIGNISKEWQLSTYETVKKILEEREKNEKR